MSSPVENILPVGADTILTISSFGAMLYQARGLTQTLKVISASKQLERTINGTLVDLSVPQFRKYQSTITVSNEVNAPPLDGIYPGMEVTVGCAVLLSYPTGRFGSPHRPEVSGSSYVEGDYTFYRPVLDMRVVDIDQSLAEWEGKNGWTLELEEI